MARRSKEIVQGAVPEGGNVYFVLPPYDQRRCTVRLVVLVVPRSPTHLQSFGQRIFLPSDRAARNMAFKAYFRMGLFLRLRKLRSRCHRPLWSIPSLSHSMVSEFYLWRQSGDERNRRCCISSLDSPDDYAT